MICLFLILLACLRWVSRDENGEKKDEEGKENDEKKDEDGKEKDEKTKKDEQKEEDIKEEDLKLLRNILQY